jgi:catechol 2,3-dioxygenase-like lactoylglutathione lyase family enzyme
MLQHKLIAVGFTGWTWWVRLRRALFGWGRPRLRALDHVTIPVRDLAAARRFYCDLLGASHLMTVDDETFKRFGRPPAPNKGEGAHHLSLYLEGATRIDLFLQQDGQALSSLGHPHFAFRVPARDLLTWQARLAAAGVPSDGPLQLGPPGQASIYFNDPFGNHLEIACLGFCGAVEHRPSSAAKISGKRR